MSFGMQGQQEELNCEEESYLKEYGEKNETKCGLGPFKPKWLQLFASKKSYVLIYGLLGMNQNAIGSYSVATISTMEKRFQLPSRSMGIIASAADVGTLCAVLILTYIGGAGHKTRWIAWGALLSVIGCFLRALPHIIFGPGTDVINTINRTTTDIICDGSHPVAENCSLSTYGWITVVILIIANSITGIGSSTFWTLGAAYLDDNAQKDKVPLLLGLSTFIRFLGPTLGFMMASYTLSIYIDPNEQPLFTMDDPRWMGAWWMGWLPLGMFHLIFSLLMALFPRTLPRQAARNVQTGATLLEVKRSFTDFKASLLRLLNNKVLMYNSMSITFYVFGMIGYFIFMPKYIETQFRKTASEASLITGAIGLVSSALGVILSGAVISKFKPRATYLAAWNVFTEAVDFAGHFAFAYLGCPKEDLYGSYKADGKFDVVGECNTHCECDSSIKYSPVCSYDSSQTYYSPCHAGCLSTILMNGSKIFTNCSCIGEESYATAGSCPVECQSQFMMFAALFFIMKFLSSSGKAGNTIIQFRVVEPADKSMAMGLAEALINIFSFIPAPILYGYLLDHSCLVWGTVCGQEGNCWLYEGKTLRYLLNYTASSFLLLATLLDVGVLANVKDLKIYDENEIHGQETYKLRKKKTAQLVKSG